jgi:hypothetical protein
MSTPSTAASSTATEGWVRAAYALLLLEVAGLVYLGSRTAGGWPVRVYMFGPLVLAALALLCVLVGLLVSWIRRPFLSRGRLGGWFVLALVIATASYPLPFPARRAERPSAVLLDLPVEGVWRVRWGGVDSDRNLYALMPNQCFGYDLVPENPGSPSGANLQVLAPCDGRVVDHRNLGMSSIEEALTRLGTYLVLEIAPGEHLFLASLEFESAVVAVGDSVARGDPLARVGSTALPRVPDDPHLILFLQDSPELLWGQGIPIVFANLQVNGARVERAQPRGQSVRDPTGSPGDRVER